MHEQLVPRHSRTQLKRTPKPALLLSFTLTTIPPFLNLATISVPPLPPPLSPSHHHHHKRKRKRPHTPHRTTPHHTTYTTYTTQHNTIQHNTSQHITTHTRNQRAKKRRHIDDNPFIIPNLLSTRTPPCNEKQYHHLPSCITALPEIWQPSNNGKPATNGCHFLLALTETCLVSR